MKNVILFAILDKLLYFSNSYQHIKAFYAYYPNNFTAP
jgi:hypothetical protein